MSKKSKKNLQKILAKRQQLQQIGATSTSELLPIAETKIKSLPVESTTVAQLPAYSHNKELIRTVISIGIITALLIAVVVYDQKRDDLEIFGNWIYQALRLNK